MRRNSLPRLLSLWLPVIMWFGVIFYFSAQPHLRITQAWYDIILRKIAHMIEYAVLARLFARALTGSTFWSWRKIFLASWVFTVLYAASDEYHQTFTEGRVGCVHDVVIDAAGALLGLGVIP